VWNEGRLLTERNVISSVPSSIRKDGEKKWCGRAQVPRKRGRNTETEEKDFALSREGKSNDAREGGGREISVFPGKRSRGWRETCRGGGG